jgi:hypothetical protein
MTRLQYLGATACLLAGLVSPASASDIIANFTLDGVTFSDDGTASGGFTLDLTTSTLSNVNITTTTGSPPDSFGTNYTDSFSNTFTNTPNAQFEFDDYYFIGSDILDIDLGVALTAANLAGSPSFSIANGSEAVFFFLCDGPDGLCGERDITGGSLDVNATPLPATLPLLAGGLGVIGFIGRRRKQKAAAIVA